MTEAANIRFSSRCILREKLKGNIAMDIIIGVLFVVFMFLVDWRLSKIHKELVELNKSTKQQGVKP